MRPIRPKIKEFVIFALALLGLSSCLSDYCEVYTEHCIEVAEAGSSDTSQSSECGDGVVQPGEACDQGPDNGPGNPCTSECLLNVCGDGEVGPTEACDDGNANDDDECTNACVLASCGDGMVGPGEACDDGNTNDDDECTNACALASCGDGIVGPGEACDDGNANEFDGCTTVCSNSEPPTLELSFSQVKQFEFSWSAVFGAEYYQLFESADVGDDFVQVGGDIVGESVVVTMPLLARLHGSYMLLACNGEGCLESVVVDVVGSLAQAVGYFKASNTGASDWFGWSVAVSGDGNTLAVGARGEDSSWSPIDGSQVDDSASNAGVVYLFVRNGEAWSQHAYVKASNTGMGDMFGWSMALSGDGNTLAVGAIDEDSSATTIGGDQANNSASNAGAVYVFVRDGPVWSQQAYIKASNSNSSDNFGYRLGLSGDGNTLAVGANYEDSSATILGGNQADNSASGSGAVYVFVRSGALWSQQVYVKASNAGPNDHFGGSVALSGDGNTLAVGAIDEDSNATGTGGNPLDNSVPGAGAVYVFVRSGALWSQQAYVKASNTDPYDHFGNSVALSGDGKVLAVGADDEDSNATGTGGDQADNAAPGAGAVYVFVRNGGLWPQQAYVKASNTGSSDYFGHDVALSSDGTTLAVGAIEEDSNATGIGGNQVSNSATHAGGVYVFVSNDAVWSQHAYVKASNTTSADWFGWSVALSGDGTTLAVGAIEEDSNATGIGGIQADISATDAGAVYLY